MKYIYQLHKYCILFLVGMIAFTLTNAQITVINMVPNAQSADTAQDSEPNITINPANPQLLAGTAFTPPPGGGIYAPIYVSIDGGNTWTLNPIVPGASALTGTGDITVRFSLNSDTLYAGTLRGNSFLTLNVLRSGNFTGPVPMTLLVSRALQDQPYVQATTVLGGAGMGNDRVYVGHNDVFNVTNRTASIEQSLNAAITTPVFTTSRLETRVTAGQDMPPIRPAIHPNGTIYAIFYRITAFAASGDTCDVVVVRDDNWGTGATPFDDLTDPSDGLAGRLVVTDIYVPWANFNQPNFGRERFVGSNISIAVDPIDDQRIYIAWADRPTGTTDYNLHVRQSTDGGVNWSAADLRTIQNATNPALAINIRGDVGFLYQQVTGPVGNQRWTTQLDITDDDFTTVTTHTLANVPTTTPLYLTQCNGDYEHLLAFGKNFIGIFSADNTPDMANFPNGVTYARNANFGTNTLLQLDGVTPVTTSIDPFFFIAVQQNDSLDFYVRDWTNSASDHDIGQEPSTEPVFYNRCDVWNRRSNAPGAFNANDQPVNEDPQSSTVGSNYAFCRVHRKAFGTAQNVTLHFLKSEFGTGSNYQDAGTAADPVLNFSATDLVKTMTSGYNWNLIATTSSHICLAVEISAPDDPLLLPSVLGNAPGWPVTDLMFINDNNKAQRNMGFYSGGGSGSVTYYAVIHNAAVFTRNMKIHINIPRETLKVIKEPKIEIIGKKKNEISKNEITLFDMLPGENRWLSYTVDYSKSMKEGLSLPVSFEEMYKSQALNGFTISPVISPVKEIINENLIFHAEVLHRINHSFNIKEAGEQSEKLIEIIKSKKSDERSYLNVLEEQTGFIKEIVAKLLEMNEKQDVFSIKRISDNLNTKVKAQNINEVVTSHSAFLHKMDAFITMLNKNNGDEADILQNIRWQKEIYSNNEILKKLDFSKRLINEGDKFIKAYQARKITNNDYPKYIEEIYPMLQKTAEAVANKVDLSKELHTIKEEIKIPQRLQKAHWEFLYKLNSL